MILWLPEMWMRQLWMIAMRQASDQIKSSGMPAGAGRCKNLDPGTCGKHQTKNHEFLVCQGLVGAEIGTLAP